MDYTIFFQNNVTSQQPHMVEYYTKLNDIKNGTSVLHIAYHITYKSRKYRQKYTLKKPNKHNHLIRPRIDLYKAKQAGIASILLHASKVGVYGA